MVSDIRQEARDSVIYLEAMCGERLDEVPVGRRDQWSSGVRSLFADAGVDINDPTLANAAFIGARFGVATLMTPDPTGRSGVAAVHLLRYLMDKSDGYEDTTRRRKFRLWLGGKVLPK